MPIEQATDTHTPRFVVWTLCLVDFPHFRCHVRLVRKYQGAGELRASGLVACTKCWVAVGFVEEKDRKKGSQFASSIRICRCCIAAWQSSKAPTPRRHTRRSCRLRRHSRASPSPLSQGRRCRRPMGTPSTARRSRPTRDHASCSVRSAYSQVCQYDSV
jgi:hypothetical protein